MSTDSALEPLPCPFCGGKKLSRRQFWLHCYDCGADGPSTEPIGTDARAIAAWNRRSRPPAPAAPVDGWRLVPVEPTDEMIAAGWIDKEDVGTEEIWQAMLAAAPAPATPSPTGAEERERLAKLVDMWATTTIKYRADCEVIAALLRAPAGEWREPTRLRLNLLTAQHHLQADGALDRSLLCDLLNAAVTALASPKQEPTDANG